MMILEEDGEEEICIQYFVNIADEDISIEYDVLVVSEGDNFIESDVFQLCGPNKCTIPEPPPPLPPAPPSPSDICVPGDSVSIPLTDGAGFVNNVSITVSADFIGENSRTFCYIVEQTGPPGLTSIGFEVHNLKLPVNLFLMQ